MSLDLKQEMLEYRALKTQGFTRINDFYNARQARRNVFTWPSSWDPWKKKIVYPMVRKATLTHANFLMGRGFNTQIDPLGTGPQQRQDAQRAEKALFKLIDDCDGWQSLWRGAQLGSLLGTSGFKVYMGKDNQGNDCAKFSACQPEFMFPIVKGDDYLDIVKMFYGYTIDRIEANRRFGVRDWKNEREVSNMFRNDEVRWRTMGNRTDDPALSDRRIPVVEVWTPNDYMLMVGGEEVYNKENEYGFVPFVVIPNIDSTEDIWGLSDVDGLIPLNQELNEVLSEDRYIVRRHMNPTIVWEGAPPDYASIAQNILGGGGVLPARPGSRIYFLTYEGQGPNVDGLIERLRMYGVDAAGLNELAWTGEATASIQTGPSLEVRFTNILSNLNAKQTMQTAGLKKLFHMLLELGSRMDTIGYTDSPYASRSKDRGMKLSGKDIGAHRCVKITWPGLRPTDDIASARFELEKMSAGLQSKFTTLEHLGFDFPDDELERMESEMSREGLNPKDNANLMRARASQLQAETKAAEGEEAPVEETPEEDFEGDLGVPETDPRFEDAEAPQDFDQLDQFPPGVGTTGDRVVGMDGYELGPLEQELMAMRAQEMRSMGRPEPEVTVPEEA